MRSLSVKLVFLLVQSLLATLALAAESLDTIIIDEGYDKQTRIAVVPFDAGPEFSNQPDMAGIISFDLSRSGQFAPLERDNMLSFPGRPEQVFFRDWRGLDMGADLYRPLPTAIRGYGTTCTTW